MHNWKLAFGVLLASVLACAPATQAVVRGQVDTFQDSTVANFGGANPTNIASGGPAGSTDEFLEISSNGQDGPASKLITYNRSQWLGDYNAAGVTQIGMDLENLGATALFIRIAFKDNVGPGAGGYSYSSPFFMPTGNGWLHTTFNLDAADFTAINSPAESLATLLSGPAEFRILSSATPSLDGALVVATLGIDNISALPAVVPEPGMNSILALGLIALLSRRFCGQIGQRSPR